MAMWKGADVMRTAGKLIGGFAVVAAGVIGSSAGASAGPSPEVLCERIGGGEIMVGTTLIQVQRYFETRSQ